MTGIKEKSLTPKDVAAIIEVCGKAQVRVLKFAGLYVEFSRKENSKDPDPGFVVSAPHVPAAEIAASQIQQANLALEQDELALKEDQLAEMWLTNPHEAEKLVINGELEEESTDGEDAEEA
jgi:hypothetical protein